MGVGLFAKVLAKKTGPIQVYKLVGPLLIPQETATAKDNVAKRIEYIQTELDRYTGVIEESQKEADAKRTKVLQMQQAAQGA